jgi:hypothetical protein
MKEKYLNVNIRVYFQDGIGNALRLSRVCQVGSKVDFQHLYKFVVSGSEHYCISILKKLP